MVAKLGIVVSLMVANVLFFFFTPAAAYGGMVGGRTKISDVKNNKEVQELGKFCVDEFNKLRRGGNGGVGGELKFSEVVEAETQIVSGVKYYMKIEANRASHDDDLKFFESVVVVKPWIHSRHLIAFNPSSSSLFNNYH